MPCGMEIVIRYRGRPISREDVRFIRELIAAHPEASRRALSRELCRAWGWVQPNGVLRDMVCRGLLLALHRAGEITLPPVRFRPPNPLARREKEKPPQPVACFAWSSAVRHLGPRDRFIGWSAEARRRNIRYLAYNTRFLILPWVDVPHLASHLLGRMVRLLPGEWERAYGHPVYYAETFVDPSRFRGVCYRAANWIYLGKTTGRGKNDQTRRPNRPLKDVWGYPLRREFRRLLGAV